MIPSLSNEQIVASREAWELTAPSTHPGCVCGHQSGVVVAVEDRFGLPVHTLRCPRCSTLRSDTTVAAEHLAAYYRDLYPVMHPGLRRDRAARERRQAGWLSSRFAVRVERGLEVGGRACRHVAGARYESHDVADAGGDPGDGYERIVALHVLEHCIDPVATLRSWARRLAPDGWMVVAVPDIVQVHHHRLVSVHGLRAWWHIAHAWNWSRVNVVLPFVIAGMTVVDVAVAPPGTLATVGSLVVRARVDSSVADYIAERSGRDG